MLLVVTDQVQQGCSSETPECIFVETAFVLLLMDSIIIHEKKIGFISLLKVT